MSAPYLPIGATSGSASRSRRLNVTWWFADSLHMRTAKTLASAILALVCVLPSCSSTPDTPENAVMDYLTSAQVGDEDADKLLCERLRITEDDEVLAELDRIVNHASVFGEGAEATQRDGDTAFVALRVLFAPSERGAVGDPWLAEVVHEDRSWKVCGFAPL
jgi:hypothetical protein